MLDTVEYDVDLRDEISFFKEPDIECPSCGMIFAEEAMRTGSGRLDAGGLDEDLHRNYLHTNDHGSIFPILYQVLTCPKCYFSALKFDFENFSKETKAGVSQDRAVVHRSKILNNLFSKMPNFAEKKTLVAGVAAYILALDSYGFSYRKDSPTIRMAICALRAAWLCKQIRGFAGPEDEEALSMLISMFYRKSFFFYDRAMELSETGVEDISNIYSSGPDFDKDYGYDGIVYMHSWLYINFDIKVDNGLTYKYEMLKKSRTNLSKVFGLGKASKEKPSSLMDVARVTFEKVQKEIIKIENDQ